MVNVNTLALSCAGIAAAAIAGSQYAFAAENATPGAPATFKAAAKSEENNYFVTPSTGGYFGTASADANGNATFTFPADAADGEYTAFTFPKSCKFEATNYATSSPKKKYMLHSNLEHSEHSEHSDSVHPQQTYGRYGGYPPEAITAIATSGVSSMSSANIGLATLACVVGTLAIL